MIELSRDGDVHILRMKKPGNTLEPEFLRALHTGIDEVVAEPNGPSALVITGEGKFFSNGLDLDIVPHLPPDEGREFSKLILGLMGRLLTLPIPVVAAVNGHAFAGGAFLAMACDFRVMREDRGWFAISEIDVGVPIGRPMMAIIQAKLHPQVCRTAVLTGYRYPGPEALSAGIVDALATEEELLKVAVAQAAEVATKERGIFHSCKKTLFGHVAELFGVEA